MRSLLIGCAMLVLGSGVAFAQADPNMTPAPDAPAMAAPADGSGMMMKKKPMMHHGAMMHHKSKMMHHRKMMMHHKKMMQKSM